MTKMYIGLHVKHPLFLSDFNESISRYIFKKYSNIKFHEHSSSGCRVVPRGRTDRQTDMMKFIVPFRNFGNVPKMQLILQWPTNHRTSNYLTHRSVFAHPLSRCTVKLEADVWPPRQYVMCQPSM